MLWCNKYTQNSCINPESQVQKTLKLCTLKVQCFNAINIHITCDYHINEKRITNAKVLKSTTDL